MSHKRSKRFQKLLTQMELQKSYDPLAALLLLKNISNEKFNPSVDLAVKLNLNPTKADQQLRGTFVLPYPVAKKVRILVIDDNFSKKDAAMTQADYYGSFEKIDEIKQGWLDFDLIITTPKMMPHLAKLGKILGPKGLMPNPKLETVSNDVVKTVIEFKRGKSKYRTDNFGNIHLPIGKLDFSVEQLLANFKAVIQLLQSKKPTAVKGTYIQNLSLSTTMSPGLKVII